MTLEASTNEQAVMPDSRDERPRDREIQLSTKDASGRA